MNKIVFLIGLLIITIQAKTQHFIELIQQEHPNFYEVRREAERHFAEHGTGKGSGYKLYQRWAYSAKRKMDANGNLRSEAEVENAYVKFRKNYAPKLNKSSNTDGQWEELGPVNWLSGGNRSSGTGRIVSIAVEKENQNLIYAGSPGGGLWKSTDAGASWTPVGDQLTNMFIWSVAIDPGNNDVVYHGNSSGDVYKSNDGGQTWNATGAQTSGIIRSILINPANSSIIFAVSSSGIYRSTNAGNNWTQVSADSTEDIVYKPGSTNVMYACGGEFRKSTDGGVTWSTISNGFVASERMKLAVTPAEPDWVYLIQKQGEGFGRIYRSSNEGNSFTIMSDVNNGADNYLGWQASRDMAIAVSPTNANEVQIAGVNYYRSQDGGANFEFMAGWSSFGQPSYVHADVEVMFFVDGILYVGSDGGVYKSSDNGDNMEDLANNGLIVTQFYRLGNSQTDENMVVGGTQDNGMFAYQNDQFTTELESDAMECFIDHSDPNYVYGTTIFGNLWRSSADLRFSRLRSPNGKRGEWVTPFEMDPINASTIYAGYDFLFKSTDRGETWSNISSNVSFDDELDLIDEFKIAPNDNNFIYMAEGGDMWRTSNGQAASPSWTKISSGLSGNVNYISVDPNDSQHLAVATSEGVYESLNGGSNWSAITNNLPDLTAECVLIDDTPLNGIYVGMDKGVYYTNDNLSQWEGFMDGLPNVNVRELEIQYSARKLRAATYGRGIWQSDLYAEGFIVTVNAVGPTNICNGESVTIEGTQGPGYSYQWRKDDLDIPGATNKDYTATEEGSYTLVANNGQISRESQAVVVTFKLKEPIDVTPLVERCGPGEVTLNAEASVGGTINWYDVPNGGNVLGSGASYVTNVNAEASFFVDETDGCTSPRAEVKVYIFEQPPLPEAEDQLICHPGGNVELSASGISDSLVWYDQAIGGDAIGFGTSINVDVTETSSYFVAESMAPTSFHGAAPDSAMGNGFFHTGGFYLIVEIYKPVVIESALVYAEESGMRTVEIRNENGDLVQTVNVESGAGASRVVLNLEVGVGTWQIGVASESNLYLNNEGVQFPYSLGRYGSVISGNVTSDPYSFYFYLYDWILKPIEEACEGPRKEVLVTVDVCSGTDEHKLHNVTLYPNPVKDQLLINVSEGFDLKSVKISNVRGEIVYEINNAVEHIDLSNFPSGVYFVELITPAYSRMERIIIR